LGRRSAEERGHAVDDRPARRCLPAENLPNHAFSPFAMNDLRCLGIARWRCMTKLCRFLAQTLLLWARYLLSGREMRV
jgi:hypothetical protein